MLNSHLLTPIFDIFLPKRCLLCGHDPAHNSLCESCRSLCSLCPIGPFVFSPDHKGALYFYDLIMRDALKGAKFQPNFAYARMLIKLLQEEIPKNEHISRIKDFKPTAVCYVPTHWVRRSLRGLDLPSMFAHTIAQYLNIPLVHALTKTTLKEPQSSLESKSSRLLAVKDLFKIRPHIKNYERLVLIDDIVTTGATFDECSRVLRKISKEIICLALAKTP